MSSAPLINQNLVQGTRIPDPVNVSALTSRSDMPIAQLGPMPLMNVPSQQIASAEKDLEPTPEIDPNLETPLLEAQIEAMFRAPEPEDFILPPALSEHAKGKTMVAQNLPKQSDIDRFPFQKIKKFFSVFSNIPHLHICGQFSWHIVVSPMHFIYSKAKENENIGFSNGLAPGKAH